MNMPNMNIKESASLTSMGITSERIRELILNEYLDYTRPGLG